MVSFGAGGGASKQKSKSKNESRTAFPNDFFDDAYSYLGEAPGYDPKYVGFEDFDKVEKNIYDTGKARADESYRGALGIQNEELSNMGLLNSPSKYIEGGARDTLNKGYMTTLQQVARDAAMQRYDLQQSEAGRRTTFNQQTALGILNRWLQSMGLAATAGRYSTGEGSSSGSSWNANVDVGFGK